MTGQGGGLPLCSPSFRNRPTFPFSSCGQPSFAFFRRLEVHNKGPACFASSPTWTSSQFPVSAAFDLQPGALPSARGHQQERAPKGRDSSHVEKGSHRESIEQVLSGVLQPVVCNPQKERETSFGHRSAIIESPHKKGEVSHGNTSKSAPPHSKGDWVISVDLTDAYLNVPIHQLSRMFLRFCYQDEVFQFRVLPFGLSVSPRVFTRVLDAMTAHVRSLGFQVHHYLDDWLLRNQQLAQLRTQTQDLLHLTTRLGWIPSQRDVRVSSNSRLCLYRHTLSNRSGTDVPSGCSVPRSSQSFSSAPPGAVCDSSGLSFTSRKAGINVRSGALRSFQILASSTLSVSSLATQSGSLSRPNSVGSSLLGPISEMVDQGVQCSSGETHSGSSPSVGHIHRCLHQRLGGPLQQSVSSRAVVSNRNISTHRRVGDVSHSEGCPALPPIYLNCGERCEFMIDHRSYTCNLKCH